MHWPQHSKYVGTSYLRLWQSCDTSAHAISEGDREPLDEYGDLICYDTPVFNETWTRMEKLYESGRAKAIGVSNFSVKKCVMSEPH